MNAFQLYSSSNLIQLLMFIASFKLFFSKTMVIVYNDHEILYNKNL